MSAHLRRAQEVFSAALKLPREERDAFVESETSKEAQVFEMVQRLLHHHDADEPLFEGMAGRMHEAAELKQIGPYLIREKLGVGGMGIVYLAEQPRPNRLVAIKVLNRLIVSPEARHRFDLEAEILGRLQHPGIAQVYESGTAEIGGSDCSYIVMEYVSGLPLDRWFAGNERTVAERVRLLVVIAEAVHHAHLRGVIHRDLKPENILIDETGRPKILDFGIAGVMEESHENDDSPETWRSGGTPGYMSPEQQSGTARIEPTMDVYALGVLADEILPRDRPSDLDWIVAMAVAEDPAQRYRTMEDLRADLQRHLDRFPVLARPQGFLYRSTRAVQRHLVLSSALLAIALTLLGGIAVSLLYAQREAASARRADQESRIARRLAYAASLSAASSAIDAGHTFEARFHLKRAPEDLRGWEFNHLSSRLDDSRWSAMLERPEHFLRLLAGPQVSPEGDTIQVVHAMRDHDRTARNQASTADENGAAVTKAILTTWSIEGKLLRRHPLPVSTKGARFRQRVGLKDDGLVSIASVDDPRVLLVDTTTLRTSEVALPDPHLRPEAPALQSSEEVAWIWNQDDELWEPAIERTVYALNGLELARHGGGEIRIWNRRESRLLRTLRHYGVCRAFFSTDGRTIASTSADGSLQIQRLDDAPGAARRFEITREWLRAGAFSPDGSLIALGDDLGTIFVLDVVTGEVLLRMHGHGHRVQSLAFTRDGQSIISVSRDGNLRSFPVLDEARPEILEGHESYVYPVTHIPDTRQLVSAGWDGSIRFWDARAGTLIASHHPDRRDPRSSIIPELVVSPDGRHIAYLSCRVVDREHRLRVIDARSCALVADLGEHEPCRGLAFSPDGETLATSADGEALLFDTSDWSLRARTPAGVSLVGFSPEGQLLLRSAEDLRDLELRDARSLRLLKTMRGSAARILALAFSPTGNEVVVSYQDRSLRVWRLDADDRPRLLDEISLVYGLSFSPDGRRLAGGAEQGLIRIWNTETWDEVCQLTGHEKYVWSLDWSADGHRLVTASGDGHLRFWDDSGLAEENEARNAHRREFERAVQRLRARLGENAGPERLARYLTEQEAEGAEIDAQAILQLGSRLFSR